MGLSKSAASGLALGSFIFNLAAQLYGMLSSPNMKDVNDANLSFYSPQPFFIAAFFSAQQVVQLAWLYRLWQVDPERSEADQEEAEVIVDYVPFYSLGNVSIGVWMFFWNASQLKISNLFVIINTVAQIYYMQARLPNLNLASHASVLTHVVNKTFAGIGVLDLLHNTSAAYFKDWNVPATALPLTVAIFAVLALTGDWIFGGCLVYDLFALAFGQKGIWQKTLFAIAVWEVVMVVLRNRKSEPYENRPLDWQALSIDEAGSRPAGAQYKVRNSNAFNQGGV